MKLIVTHFSPDLDAVASVWLIKRFFKGFKKAEVKFVAAGGTWQGQVVDSNPEVIHVDTGLGKFDHHNTDEDQCAAGLVLNYIYNKNDSGQARMTSFWGSASWRRLQNQILKQVQDDGKNNEALERLIDVVNDIDHFREVNFPNPTADFYDFGLIAQLDGWKLLYSEEPERIVDLSLNCLDGIYKQLQNKVWAEKLLESEGVEFETKWGKGIGVETNNDEVIHTGQKQGYVIVIRKDPKKGYVRLKSLPDPKIDLTELAEKLKKADKEATWFLHVGKHMILNGSTKNPKMKPTKLTLREIIEIVSN